MLDCKKIMKNNSHPQNLASIKPPKFDSEIDCARHFQNNTSFVATNEKSIYSSQNYVMKTISVLLNIASSVFSVCGSNSSETLLNHVTL